MISLSTSVISDKRSAADFVAFMQGLGDLEIDLGFELGYHLEEELLGELVPLLRANSIPISSIHHVCPRPPAGRVPPWTDNSASKLTLHQDREIREIAVALGMRTLELANELEAPAVVFHLGRLDMDNPMPEVRRELERQDFDEEQYAEFLEGMRARRAEAAAPGLDHACRALDKWLRRAEALGVAIGAETPYHYHELPDFDEVGLLLAEFDGAPLGYWHDTGHAEVHRYLKLQPEENDWLAAYRDRLVGVHIHQCEGYRDHHPPAEGQIDLARLRKYLKPETIKVVELVPPLSDGELRDSLLYLKKLGFA